MNKKETILNDPINFKYKLKTYKNEGNLAWEYNPLHNLRLEEDSYYYKETFYTKSEIQKVLNFSEKQINDALKKSEEELQKLPNDDPLKKFIEVSIYKAGQLIDFDTQSLEFSLNNPIEMIPQYSYDGSIDLIISDNKNTPKIINTRFSAQDLNTYKVLDRQGDADTNIYDDNNKFNSQISLQKIVKKIPKLEFLGTEQGGNLPIGHYHFYFTYLDADGNETDFVCESGLVAVFIGDTPSNIKSGIASEGSKKMVSFKLTNIDSEYQYIKVYYSRATSELYQSKVITAHRIDDKFVSTSGELELNITGFEHTTQVPLEALNPLYQHIEYNKSEAVVQNRLFVANTKTYETQIKDLQTLSLMFLPNLNLDKYYDINSSNNQNNYYDSKFIYNYVGYWDQEIYRFGIVYILNNGQLSPVFNVRGKEIITDKTDFVKDGQFENVIDLENKKINHLQYNESTYILNDTDDENIKGVVKLKGLLNKSNIKQLPIYGIQFETNKQTIKYLKEVLKIKGFFFVRQKRIPTILTQAWTIGVDKESHIPMIPKQTSTKDYYNYEYQSFVLANNAQLSPSLRVLDNVDTKGAICPDYDINSAYLNNYFNGGDFKVRYSAYQFNQNNSKFTFNSYDSKNIYFNTQIIGVEDGVKLMAIEDTLFSTQIGDAGDAKEFKFVGTAKKAANVTPVDIVRGNYGPYLGIIGLTEPSKLIDIMIPGFDESQMDNYFKIRYNDNSYFSAISERFDINNEQDINKYEWNCYRGDCYIAKFTHRVNRNFNDSVSPTNDTIVNPYTWAQNVKYNGDLTLISTAQDKKIEGRSDIMGIENVNIGDINAVKLGMWVTIPIRSSFNLNLRTTDDSSPSEDAMFGHPKGFYPYYEKLTDGAYKTKEALCFNMGFDESLSQRYNFALEDKPIILSQFPNRISYSDINVPGSFQNGYRIFREGNYKDYPMSYGAIIKILEYFGSLLVVFEHGIGIVPVNERVQSGEGDGGLVYINTPIVLPDNPKIISDKFGSQWAESIIKTPRGVYGVDTVAKKIWRVQGENIEIISDFRIQKFLNENISLSERELTPVIGVRNVKSHFNAFKNDVMFTFYDNLYGTEEKVWNLCWNEVLNNNQGSWVTFYSWLPSYSENIYNQYFTFNRNTSKYIAKLGVGRKDNQFADGIVLDENIIYPYLYYKKNIDDKWERVSKITKEGRYKGHKDFLTKIPKQIIDDWENKYKSDLFTFDFYNNSFNESENGYEIGTFSLANREIPTSIVNYNIEYILEEDNYNVYKNFSIIKDNDNNYKLYYKGYYSDLCAELYGRIKPGTEYNNPQLIEDKEDWEKGCVKDLRIYYDSETGNRVDYKQNENRIITSLNVKAEITGTFKSSPTTMEELLNNSYLNNILTNVGRYSNTIAITTKHNLSLLTTDFWKHGQSGIIDIKTPILPTKWYGEQHPFEFEFVVAENPELHKIFDNLEIISNNAEPESFHYEVNGDSYEFAKNKKNMYIRQEATKELYQRNGSNITFDHDYTKLKSNREHPKEGDDTSINDGYTDKSTLLPLHYTRVDKIDRIEHSYVSAKITNNPKLYYSEDYPYLSGGEIKHDSVADEYSIVNHSKAIDIKESGGLLTGNMNYKEDKWYVQINPINIVQTNEPSWKNSLTDRGDKDLIPVEIHQNPSPDDTDTFTKEDFENDIKLPESFGKANKGRGVVEWQDDEVAESQVKIKDKFIKIRIRYSGKKLAIIHSINTLYSTVYG